MVPYIDMHEFSECDILGVLLALVLDRRQRKVVVFRLDLVGLRLLVVLRVLDLFRIASGLGVFDALHLAATLLSGSLLALLTLM